MALSQENRAMHLLTFVRWLARKDRKAPRTDLKPVPTAQEIEDYLILVELMKEAWEEQSARKPERMSLARKAVIAEIRDKGRKVNSIAPEELQRLIVAYLREHLEENVIGTFPCL